MRGPILRAHVSFRLDYSADDFSFVSLVNEIFAKELFGYFKSWLLVE